MKHKSTLWAVSYSHPKLAGHTPNQLSSTLCCPASTVYLPTDNKSRTLCRIGNLPVCQPRKVLTYQR